MPNKYKRNIEKKEELRIVCQNEKCDKKGKGLKPEEFYKVRGTTNGHHPYCKDCVEKTVDVNNLQTVLDVLKVLNIPFIMDEWNVVCNSCDQKYMSNYIKRIGFTKRNKYLNLRFNDSVYELSKNEGEKVNPVVEKQLDEAPKWDDEWQGSYTASDLKYLNNYYAGLNNDFKIITTNHRDYARKIAQSSLSQMKAYQKMLSGIEGGDVAYEKATKIFDMLSKSAQFAESQRGANDVSLGCFGRVFDAVEKHNWVPQHVPEDEDLFDKIINQFSNIKRSL